MVAASCDACANIVNDCSLVSNGYVDDTVDKFTHSVEYNVPIDGGLYFFFGLYYCIRVLVTLEEFCYHFVIVIYALHLLLYSP